jgi:hypothetical protein
MSTCSFCYILYGFLHSYVSCILFCSSKQSNSHGGEKADVKVEVKNSESSADDAQPRIKEDKVCSIITYQTFSWHYYPRLNTIMSWLYPLHFNYHLYYLQLCHSLLALELWRGLLIHKGLCGRNLLWWNIKALLPNCVATRYNLRNK